MQLFQASKWSLFLKNNLRPLVRSLGLDLVRYYPATEFPCDFDPRHTSIIRAVKNYTMTSPERLSSLIDAVDYITRNSILGSIVECGVWRGGSMMAAALALKSLDTQDRDLHLFDTFEGMTKPQDEDVDVLGNQAESTFAKMQTGDNSSSWCLATLPDVQAAMASTGYDMRNVHFHKGRVEATIPDAAPSKIALLRLDTDWYDSTLHELEHLYPRLSPGGILILDDYRRWLGSRKATDEYVEAHAPSLFLSRIDDTGAVAVKTT
jgi:hypothetical protein